MRVKFVSCVAVVLLAWPLLAGAQSSRSAASAAELVSVMRDRGLDAIAAADPLEAGRFVAALCYPGTQLLVVSGRYPVPTALRERLVNHEDREVYMDLQGAAAREGRFFVQDAGADGLAASQGEKSAVDVIYVDGTQRTAFDGKWKAQQLTEAEYNARFAAADARYGTLLATLLSRVNAPTR